MFSPKPTFVLVPGAFHTSACYSYLVPYLKKAGHSVQTVTLPGISNGNVTLSDDIAYLRENVLLPLFNSQSDVVLVVHSYGGCPGSGAIIGLSKKEREAQGQGGGIIGVVYLAAMVPNVGARAIDGIGGSFKHWHHLDESTGLITVSEAADRFYNDVPAALLSQILSELRGHSLKTWMEPLATAGYTDPLYRGRLAYVKTMKDNAFAPEEQEKMVAESGVEWIVREIETGHSPFVVEPKLLAEILVEVVNGWIRA